MESLVKANKREDGFTLVEILIVIAIIGVLAAIAVPVFSNQRVKAKTATLESDLHTVRLAYDACKTSLGEGGSYPDTYIGWSGKTTYGECGQDLKLSTENRIHAFDMEQYYPAISPTKGAIYCIEIGNNNGALYYRSDRGLAEKASCQNQGPAI